MSVSLQSTASAIPTSTTICPAGAISGICIGAQPIPLAIDDVYMLRAIYCILTMSVQ